MGAGATERSIVVFWSIARLLSRFRKAVLRTPRARYVTLRQLAPRNAIKATADFILSKYIQDTNFSISVGDIEMLVLNNEKGPLYDSSRPIF